MVKIISSNIKKLCDRFYKQADNNREVKDIKLGFSLVEVLVSMLIVSVFFLATTKVLTQKQKVEYQKNPHGYYECYKAGSGLFAHRSDGPAETDHYATTSCYLIPPKGINFVNIHYIEPGNPGKYYNIQEPIFNLDFGPYDSPEAFMATLEELGIQVYPDYMEAADRQVKWRDDKQSFHKYLEISHPNAKILNVWGSSANINPPTALLIAW